MKKESKNFVLLLHNIRSTHNVGSILRTADGFNASCVYMTGYSPYPKSKEDSRLPHISNKLDNKIHKTALGAEKIVKWQYVKDVEVVLTHLKADGYILAALEQGSQAVDLPLFKLPRKTALILGNELTGIDKEVLACADVQLQIPMYGSKESFNVAVAAAIAMYHLRFYG